MERKQGNPNDHLANERTFLAWVRTGVAIMAFGFVVVKFALFIKQIAFLLGERQELIISLPSRTYSSIAGITLVSIGILLMLAAYIQYLRHDRQIRNHQFTPSPLLALLTTIGLSLVGILIVIYLSLHTG